MRRMRTNFTCAVLGTGLGLLRTASADEVAAPVSLSIDHKALERLTWSDHLKDWRSRLIGERVARMPALGWVATRIDSGNAKVGWSFDVDPGRDKFVIKYSIRY
jgi:hypothetical protein